MDTAKRECLELPVNSEQKLLFERAAAVRGQTLTDFVIGVLEQTAGQIVRESEADSAAPLRLSPQDSLTFARTILDPPEPATQVVDAHRRARDRGRALFGE